MKKFKVELELELPDYFDSLQVVQIFRDYSKKEHLKEVNVIEEAAK